MSGIAAFINGGVDGINMRHAWDDRKRQQTLEDEQMDWNREDREYTLSERERIAAERARIAAENARMRSIYEDGDARVGALMDAQGQPGTERGVANIPDTDAPIVETALPPIGQAQVAPTDTPESVAYDTEMALRGAPIDAEEQIRNMPPRSGEVPGYLGTGVTDPQEVEAERARLEQMRGAKERSLLVDVEPKVAGEIHEAPSRDGYFGDTVDYTGPMTRTVLPENLAYTGGEMTGGDRSDIASYIEQAQTENAAPETASEQVAEVVASRELSIAPNGNANTPIEVQRERATKSYMQMWEQEVMPDIIREMLRTGDYEGARRFQEFMSSGETQQANELLAGMLFSANLGDLDATLDAATEIYNLPGYYDDGYSVVRDQSGWAQDEQGNTTGINIAFRNDQTGEVFMRNFAGQEDLIRSVSRMFDPQQVFNDVAAADAARTAETKHAQSMELQVLRNQGGEEQGGITRDQIDDAIKLLGQDISFSQLPLEEQIQKAVDYINQREAAFAAGTNSLGSTAGGPMVWTGD